MFTRAQYLDRQCTHREYWAQFVTEGMRRMVLQRFTIERLKRSTDPHLNDIPLMEWDAMKGVTFHMLDLTKWREIHYPEYKDTRSIGWSMSDNTCLLKEAAKQLIEKEMENV